DAGVLKHLAIARRVGTFEHEHCESRATCQETTSKVAKRECSALRRRNLLRLSDCQELDEKTWQLDDAVVRSPGMPIARTDREPEAAVKRSRRVEIVHRMNDVVEPAGHGVQGFGSFISPKKTPSAAAADC